ncbi:MAG TPA: ATP cone domain-containing protein, partial [bacterium]|nr:ATP cone domain-containing protein [bacterium]
MVNKITHVMKRDGTIVPFDREKVVIAIYKAAAAVGGHNRPLSEKLADESIEMMNQCFQPPEWPSVEEVQDIVEKVLIENGHAKTAKAYIVYRENRRRERERKAATRGKESPLPYRIMYETLVWSIDHGCETIQKLNERVKDGSFPDLIHEADEAYGESIVRAAEAIASERDRVRL